MEGAATGGCANTIPRASRSSQPARSLDGRSSPMPSRRRCFVLALTVAITGGFVIWFTEEARLSVRFAGRPFLLGCLIADVRFYFVRQPSPLADAVVRAAPAAAARRASSVRAGARAGLETVGEFVLVTAGCCGFIAIATWPQVAQPYAVSDMGDPLFSVWRLMWVTHEFVRESVQYLQRQPVLSRAPDAHLLGSGPDARAAVRAPSRAGPAPSRRLQHRVSVGRGLLRRRDVLPGPCTDRPAAMRRGLARRSSPCIPIASSTSRISSCR